MEDVEFSQDKNQRVVNKVKTYFNEELKQSIGGFQAEFPSDVLGKEIGFYYLQCLAD